MAATAEPEPSQASDRFPADPVASFLKIDETLDRITRPAAPQSPDGAAGGTGEKDVPDPTAPVPVVDDNGVPIQGAQGAMMRPVSLPPQFFVEKGLADRKIMERLVADNGLKGLRLVYEYEQKELANFKHFAPWDAQRLGGKFHREFIDYSTVAIGLYAAAAGIPEPAILMAQDPYARTESNFDRQSPDQNNPNGNNPDYNWLYRYLLNENIKNTDIGYDLYSAGRIKAR